MYSRYNDGDQDDYINPYEDYIHVDNIKMADVPIYENCQSEFRRLLTCVYESGDIETMEDSLDELVSLFGLRLPAKSPVLTKKPETKIFDFMVDLTKEQELFLK